MIITIFGATTLVGKQTIDLALAKEFTVKAFGRNIVSLIDRDLHSPQFEALKGHVFDEAEVRDAIIGSDAIISTLGNTINNADNTRSLGIKNIIKQMQTLGVKRLIALGDIGTLYNKDQSLLIDTPEFAQDLYPAGPENLQVYKYLQSSTLDWTFVCAPTILHQDTSDHYITNTDYLPHPNLFEITAANLAHFMLTEVVANKFVKHRVGISNA